MTVSINPLLPSISLSWISISSTYIDRQFNDVYTCTQEFDIKSIRYNSREVSKIKLMPSIYAI